MTTEMDWSHEYCLNCDRQLSEGAYCSQACRLADLEKAAQSENTTASYLSTSAASTSSYGSRTSSVSSQSSAGLHLPPALNFAAYKPSMSHTNYAPSPTTAYSYYGQSSTAQSYYAAQSPAVESPPRQLSPSSSRSSLSSVGNYQTTPGMSPQTATALRGYVHSFDQVRENRRRTHRKH